MKFKKVNRPFYLKNSNFFSELAYTYKYINKHQYHQFSNISKNEVEINIPWHVTNNIEEAQLVLNKMFYSLSKNSSLYNYLDIECRWLLEPLKGNFIINEILGELSNYIFSKTITYNLNNNIKSENHPRKLAGISGCYLFTNVITNQQYIGSSIDLYNRFKSHKINSIRPYRGGNTPLYKSVELHTWSNFTWTPIYISTNHINTFIKKNQSLKAKDLNLLNPEMLTDPEIYILRSFTQFEARIYEQSLITHIKPVLNNALFVTFPFLNWREGDTGLNK